MIYEFECEKCGNVTEAMFSVDKRPDSIKCECGGKAKRMISQANWILKGPGDDWPSQQIRRKNQLTRNNEAAGERGRGEWSKRMPRLSEKLKQD